LIAQANYPYYDVRDKYSVLSSALESNPFLAREAWKIKRALAIVTGTVLRLSVVLCDQTNW
jgi:hypothetical protein